MTRSSSNTSSVSFLREFKAGRLIAVFNQFKEEKRNGIYIFNADIKKRQEVRSSSLVFNNGELVYGSSSISTAKAFVTNIGKRLKIENIQHKIKFASERTKDSDSVKDLLNIMVRINILSWREIEDICFFNTVMALERILPHSGAVYLEEGKRFDLLYGVEDKSLSWQRIYQKLNQRQREWAQHRFDNISIDSIPVLVKEGAQQDREPAEFKKVYALIDNDRTLSEIADHLNIDPLKLAKLFKAWKASGTIRMQEGSENTSKSTTTAVQSKVEVNTLNNTKLNQRTHSILCVDDSAIVRTMIKRVLEDRYAVKLASNAVEALSILNKETIDLVLLDVTMPDIDGYEVCKTIRKIDRLKDIPIVMVTAKDSMFDKVKGKIAGTSRYLTKPVNSSELISVVDELVVINMQKKGRINLQR